MDQRWRAAGGRIAVKIPVLRYPGVSNHRHFAVAHRMETESLARGIQLLRRCAAVEGATIKAPSLLVIWVLEDHAIARDTPVGRHGPAAAFFRVQRIIERQRRTAAIDPAADQIKAVVTPVSADEGIVAVARDRQVVLAG